MQLENSTSLQIPLRNELPDQIRDTLKVRFEQFGINITEDERLLNLCVEVATSIMVGSSSDSVWQMLKDPRKGPSLKRIISAIFGPFHKGKEEIYPSYFTLDEWKLYYQRAGRDAPLRITQILH